MNDKTRAIIEAKAERQGVPGKCNMCFIEGAEAMEKIAADEIAEQCRLNAMGQERELKLMAEVKSCAEREAKLVAERDAYALAMKVALEDGIFTHKSATKAKIEKLLQPFLAEHHAAKGER